MDMDGIPPGQGGGTCKSIDLQPAASSKPYELEQEGICGDLEESEGHVAEPADTPRRATGLRQKSGPAAGNHLNYLGKLKSGMDVIMMEGNCDIVSTAIERGCNVVATALSGSVLLVCLQMRGAVML